MLKRKIVFASHDPGGCNLLIPIIEFLESQSDYSIFLLVLGPAKNKVVNLLNSRIKTIELDSIPLEKFPNEYDVKQSEVIAILDDINPDIIFTSTSINSNIERYAIGYGKKTGTPTISYIDSWIGEDIRFSSEKINVSPNYILVCDPQMGVPYLKFESQGSKIVTIGNPHLEKLSIEYQNWLGSDEVEPNRVLFFCENIMHYYPEEEFNEIAVLQAILMSYNYRKKLNIVVRPHPLESESHWLEFIKETEGANKYITISLDKIRDVRESIKKSSLTFGISSMALIESSIMGKYTFSFQVGIQGNRKFLYIPFETYGISSLSQINEVCEQLSLAGTKTSGYRGNSRSRVMDNVMNLLTIV